MPLPTQPMLAPPSGLPPFDPRRATNVTDRKVWVRGLTEKEWAKVRAVSELHGLHPRDGLAYLIRKGLIGENGLHE